MNTPHRDAFFRELTLRICGSLDIGEALSAAFDYLDTLLPLDRMGLHRIDRERMGIHAVASVSRDTGVKLVQEDRGIVVVGGELLQWLTNAATGRTANIHNRPETLPPALRQCFPELIGCSVLGLPLRLQGEQVGGLALAVHGYDRYTPDHAALLDSVMEPIAMAMSNAWRHCELRRLKELLSDDNRALTRELEQATGTQVVGAEFGLRQVMDLVRRVAPMASPVLLLGETGTGKEVVANAIHLASPRRDGPMIRVPCGAIPETLLDSELFGHEKGAFTGATERKRGRFERADGGTLFLDEIGELTPEAQVKLLRVLQEKEFERVGGTQTVTVDVRVIAATHRDLGQMVRAGRFREDLWYRLNVFPIYLPPLRLRREDIPSLAQHFVERKARELSLERTPTLDAETLQQLQGYDWPGNVRELQNLIERALILGGGGPLRFPELPAISRTSLPVPPPLTAAGVTTPAAAAAPVALPTLDEAAAAHIRHALELTRGRIAGPGGAAERLAINPSTLRSRMRKLGIR